MMRTSTPDRDVARRRAEEDEEAFTGSFSKKTPPKKTTVSDRRNHYTFRSVLALRLTSHWTGLRLNVYPLTAMGLDIKNDKAGQLAGEFARLTADRMTGGITIGLRERLERERRACGALYRCKHFRAIEEGFRESKQIGKAALMSLRNRGVGAANLAVGNAPLGSSRLWPRRVPHDRSTTLLGVQMRQHTRLCCPRACRAMRSRCCTGYVRRRTNRTRAHQAFDPFVANYEAKYPKAVSCLVKDSELVSFYDFPAVHRRHLATTNAMESTFANIRLRIGKTRSCVSVKRGLSFVHQFAMSAKKRWRRLREYRQLIDVVEDVKFIAGINETKITGETA